MVREPGPSASVGVPAEAAAFGEVVLIATPYGALETIGHELGGALKGKIVLDACNPYPPDPEAFRREIETAGVAVSTAKYLPGVRLVRAFSAVDATSVEASAAGRGARLGVPLASDDEDALRVAERAASQSWSAISPPRAAFSGADRASAPTPPRRLSADGLVCRRAADLGADVGSPDWMPAP